MKNNTTWDPRTVIWTKNYMRDSKFDMKVAVMFQDRKVHIITVYIEIKP